MSRRRRARGVAGQAVLRLSCADVPGIVADGGLNIVESAQFLDRATGRFFMRVEAEPVAAGPADLDALRAGFSPLGARFGFGIIKRGMKGIYQHCGERHLHPYLAGFDFRYNNRIKLSVDDGMRAEAALLGVAGKRLTYRTTH